MFRITVEGKKVDKYETVWEIMYRYVNPEVSLAYPQEMICKDVPEGVRIWKYRNNCFLKCARINNSNEPPEPSTRKILPLP